jgi:hypothetical protein
MDNDFNVKYRETVERWLATRDRGRFEVVDRSEADTTRMQIRPVNARACSVSFSSRNGSTQICLGTGVCFDEVDGLYASNGDVFTSVLTELRLSSLLEAVWAGKLRERIQTKKGSVVGREALLLIDGKEYRSRERQFGRLLSRADDATDVTYEPYES